MHIKFVRSGGLFAGNVIEGTAEISDHGGELRSGDFRRALSPEEAQSIRESAKSVFTSGVAGDLRELESGGSPDRYQYDITVEGEEGSRSFTAGDGPVKQTEMQSGGASFLADWVRKQIGEIRKSRTK